MRLTYCYKCCNVVPTWTKSHSRYSSFPQLVCVTKEAVRGKPLHQAWLRMSSHGIISAQPSVAVPISVKLQNLEHQLLLSCTSKSIVHFSAERGLLTLRQTCSQEIPGSAVCVQKFDDSLGFAIRPTYRISLCSSSLWEPRHPSLKVVF